MRKWPFRGRGWGLSEPPPWPTGPPCTEEDVVHLVSTLVGRLRLGTPGINTFSGDATLGKTEVLFEQWYHEVQCVKDHYPESVVWESIIRSLKGAAADMAWYMVPTTRVAHILRKLSVIFGTVASFDVLMQNFYKVMQGNNKKVPSFATRLKGTLNQIRLQCPGRMLYLEVQQHLMDCLFHLVWKHIWGTAWYLYSTPRTSYSQLMVAAYKPESENKEIWHRVRARAVVATNSGEGMVELGQQIARLMAALTKAGQGSNPSSAPSSPQKRGHGRGHNGSSTFNRPSSHNSTLAPQFTYGAWDREPGNWKQWRE